MLQTPGGTVYQQVLKKTAAWGNASNLMFVIGATRYEMVGDIRKSFPDHFFLVPGVGAQGGSLEEISQHGMNSSCGLLVNASRAIIFASADKQFAKSAAQASKNYHDEMRGFLDTIAK
jgi:orotidine-5'-phosphate decarboxylase